MTTPTPTPTPLHRVPLTTPELTELTSLLHSIPRPLRTNIQRQLYYKLSYIATAALSIEINAEKASQKGEPN